VSKEKMEFKDRRVYPVFKESMVHKDRRVFRVFREYGGILVRLDLREIRDLLDLLEIRDLLE
jgi:hypothetical protein